MRILIVLLLPILSFAQPSSLPGCKATDKISKALQDILKPGPGEQDREYKAVEKERLEKFKALADAHPDDFFAQKAYIQRTRGMGRVPDDVLARYADRAAKAPRSPEARFLYAISLIGRETPKSIEMLNGLAAEHPDFVWVPQALSLIHTYPNFKDTEKLQTHAAAFLKACPENVDAYRTLVQLPDGPVLRESAPKFRTFLSGRTDDDSVGAWRILWNIEFKVTPAAEHPKVREQVKQDIEWLKKIDPKEHKPVVYSLREGYTIIGEKEAAKALAASETNAVGRYFEFVNEWSKKNPAPKPGDPEEKRKAYHEARLAAIDEVLAKGPITDPFLYLQRLSVLAELKDRPEADFLATADNFLELSKKRKSSVYGAVSHTLTLAELYTKRGVRLEQVPELVRQGLLDSKNSRNWQSETDLFEAPSGLERASAARDWWPRTSAWNTLIDAYLQMKKFDQARTTIIDMETGLADRKSLVSKWKAAIDKLPKDKPKSFEIQSAEMAVKNLPTDEARVQKALARLAAAENRKLDALAYYQSALRLISGRGTALEKQWTAKAEETWKGLGGTHEGWQKWLEQLSAPGGEPKADTGRWLTLDRPLPDFKVSDLSGKTWTKDALGGKTVFVNLWATWCGPCRQELPHFQKLYERMKPREDVLVITFNLDEGLGSIEPFMRENKYTFPVLLASDMVKNFLGSVSIPRNWVVDRNGVLRYEQIGFGDVESEEFIKQMTAQVELVRGR